MLVIEIAALFYKPTIENVDLAPAELSPAPRP